MQPLNVLSLFDGISCGRLALERAGIPIATYYASEVDKYAIKIAMKNFPHTVQLGSIVDIKINSIGQVFVRGAFICYAYEIDLLIGGSPCQGFSFAGKQLNFDDPRSKLFFEYVRILKEIRKYNPDVKFLLENVKMKKEYQDVISEQLGVQPIEINSALVSAQNRKRLYWTNIAGGGIAQPCDKGIDFQSALEKDEARKNKAYALTATYYKKGAEATRQRNFIKCQRPIAWISDENTRWLTPIECERLQTLPDNYTEGISNTQRYRSIGNGWTVDVIAHILSYLKLQ